MEDCAKAGIKYIELPVAFDALTVVINPKNDWIKQLTVAELKKMWEPGAQGKITKWNQVNPAWPDAAQALRPGADSGTFDYFTEAVNGKSKSSRGDFTASEDDNVLVQGVSRDNNALGFFGFAYYDENKGKLKAVPIVNPKGKAVALDRCRDGRRIRAAGAPDLHLRQRQVDGQARGQGSSSSSTSRKAASWPRKSSTCRSAPPTTSMRWKTSRRRRPVRPSAAMPKSASRCPTC
jgi:hypothetical protein